MTKEFFLAFIVSLDIYFAAAVYRSSGIRIPVTSAAVISLISAGILGLCIKFSELLGILFSAETCRRLCTSVLILIGAFFILKSLMRTIFRSLTNNGSDPLKIKLDSVVLMLCLDDTAADFDHSKVLTLGEAAAFAAATSLDSAAIGLSCGIGGASPLPAAVFTFICGASAIFLGTLTGKKISSLDHDLSWLAGIFLIIFAFIET